MNEMSCLSSEAITQKVIDMVKNGEPSAKIADYIHAIALNEKDLRFLICVALGATRGGI